MIIGCKCGACNAERYFDQVIRHMLNARPFPKEPMSMGPGYLKFEDFSEYESEMDEHPVAWLEQFIEGMAYEAHGREGVV